MFTLKGQVLGIDFLIIGIIYIICGCLAAISEVILIATTETYVLKYLAWGIFTGMVMIVSGIVFVLSSRNLSNKQLKVAAIGLAGYCRILAGLLLVESVLVLFSIGMHEGIKGFRYYKYRDDPYYLFDFLGTPYVRYVQLIVGFTVIVVTQFTNGQGKTKENEEDNNDYVTMSVIE